jgi:plasmid stabilization system protein ParE
VSTPQIVFRPQAANEVRSACDWYEEQKPGLGARFAHALDELLQRIAERSSAFPLVRGEIRRAVLRQFPYGIYFREAPDGIVVLGVIHSHRHPRHWQSRS